jgi:hypothetical protein
MDKSNQFSIFNINGLVLHRHDGIIAVAIRQK